MPVAMITGITGQDGSYLAEQLLADGYEVVGTRHPGAAGELPDYFKGLAKRVSLLTLDLGSEDDIRAVIGRIRPGGIYNLAARASSRHLYADPVLTGDINGLAVGRLLEAIRVIDPAIRFCQASSSELYGFPECAPQDEQTVLRPVNPYGAAKLYAHCMVSSYRQTYGLFACSAILFNHESPRRGTDFVTRRVSDGVARIKLGLQTELALGSLEVRRDWGFAGDYARAMKLMLRHPVADDYVVATGELHSVRELCEVAFARAGLDYRDHVRVDPTHQRVADEGVRVGNAARARDRLGWSPTVGFRELIEIMVDGDIRRLQGGTTENEA